MKIYTPVKDFNGLRNNVRFINGIGETDDPKLIEWFRNHGYKIGGSERVENTTTTAQVEENSTPLVGDVEVVDQPHEPNFDDMTPNELRDWMRANGYGTKIKNTRNKEKLLEILRG